jgi:hypothetical protein
MRVFWLVVNCQPSSRTRVTSADGHSLSTADAKVLSGRMNGHFVCDSAKRGPQPESKLVETGCAREIDVSVLGQVLPELGNEMALFSEPFRARHSRVAYHRDDRRKSMSAFSALAQ